MLEIGADILKEPQCSGSMKLKKDQISLMKAKVKDEADKPSIINGRNNGVSAKDKSINKVSYANQDLFRQMLRVEGR